MTSTTLLTRLLAELPGGRVRPEQVRMVEAVEQAIASSRHLLVQAGTGTGKTLGYLVPAVDAGGRVVVATATKALAERIAHDDLPRLARALRATGGREVTHALLKGRANYLCRAKVAELLALEEQEPAPAEALFELPPGARTRRPDRRDLAGLAQLLEWARHTATGDRSEAPPATERAWGQVSTDAAHCPGAAACAFARGCFAERARAAARTADVVVTSHAQVAHDLRSATPLLGRYDVLVLDEAHEVEAALSSAWGREVVPPALAQVVASASRALPRGPAGAAARAVAAEAADDLAALGEALEGAPPGLRPVLPGPVAGLLATAGRRLAVLATALERSADGDGVPVGLAADRRAAAARTAEAARAVAEVLLCPEGCVRWLEGGEGGRAPVLRTAPLEVGPQLVAALGERTLVATSATLTVAGSFDAAARALGLAGSGFDAVDVGTPFDHDRQAMLYVPPPSFPAPVGRGRVEHAAAVHEEVAALVRAAGGRTLALFTSRRAAEEAAARLRRLVATPVLVQGEAPPSQLVRAFTEVEEATLCATTGFWQGVDVPGPSLSCVVIDKIPFAPVDDPLTAARRAAADAAGRDGFTEVCVSAAARTLAQGAGRLVRTGGDRGVVAVLDPRLRTRGYGAVLRASLPPMRTFADRAVVEGALRRLTGGAAAA